MRRATQILLRAITNKKVDPNLASSLLIDGTFCIELQNAQDGIPVGCSGDAVINELVSAVDDLEKSGIVKSKTSADLKSMAAEFQSGI